jgi:hypothetical protein
MSCGFPNIIQTNPKQLILYSYCSFRIFPVPVKSDISNATFLEYVYSRRNSPEEEIKKKLSDHLSKGMVVTAKTVAVPQFRRLGAGFPPRRPSNPGQVMWDVVDKVALG